MRLYILIIYEVVAVLFIYRRLWNSKNGIGVVERCVLSVVILIPIFGWIFYIFVRPSPDAHGEDVGDHSCGGGTGDTDHHY